MEPLEGGRAPQLIQQLRPPGRQQIRLEPYGAHQGRREPETGKFTDRDLAKANQLVAGAHLGAQHFAAMGSDHLAKGIGLLIGNIARPAQRPVPGLPRETVPANRSGMRKVSSHWRIIEMIRKKAQDVMGHRLQAPALTRTGLKILLGYVALPIVALLALADVGLYLFFKYALGQCYGLWCLF